MKELISSVANGATARLLLRYVVGGLFMGSVAIGNELALDPDLVEASAVLIGLCIEGFYFLAKKRGWTL